MSKITIMVASTVYGFQDQLAQICAILEGYGYQVWNSHIGTIPLHPGRSNQQICIDAAGRCDVFLGILRPFYGSGIIGPRSITHEEFLTAINSDKPRWALVHHDVAFARQLLKPYMFKKNGQRTAFRLKKNPVMDDLRVIDLYNDALLADIPPPDRIGHWVQEYFKLEDILEYLEHQFSDIQRVANICREMEAL